MSDKKRAVRFELVITVITVGKGYMAVGNLAGMTFKGTRQDSEVEACHALFYQFLHGQQDAELALDLAVNGEDYTVIEKDVALAAEEMAAPALEASKQKNRDDIEAAMGQGDEYIPDPE